MPVYSCPYVRKRLLRSRVGKIQDGGGSDQVQKSTTKTARAVELGLRSCDKVVMGVVAAGEVLRS
jgi:hypothetical protein